MQGLNASAEMIEQTHGANTAGEVLEMAQNCGIALADKIACEARDKALILLQEAPVSVEVMIINREGSLVGHAPFPDKR